MKNKKVHQESWEKKVRKLLAELTTILIETGSAERIIAKRDEVMDFIRQLLSQQKQDIIENMKITQFDVDDVMNQWTDYDWVDAWKDDIEIADLINAKIKSKLNNL